MQIVARWIGHTCIKLGSFKWWTFPPGIFTTWNVALFSPDIFFPGPFLTFSFQAAESPKPRDIESPKDSGVRKRKGGQANVNGQVIAISSWFFPLILDWLSGCTRPVPDCCLDGLCPFTFPCFWRFRQRPAWTAVTCLGKEHLMYQHSTLESFAGLCSLLYNACKP